MKRKLTERQAFEAWVTSCIAMPFLSRWVTARYKHRNGEYNSAYMQLMFQAWQASARRKRK